MPTAFLTASTFEVLPFLGTPGAATVGHALVWSESPKGFTLSPISVGPDQFSGVLPISKGGTGTSNGSITGTGALTFAAGGTNQEITLTPSGTASVSVNNNLNIVLADNQNNSGKGFSVVKGSGYFTATNGVGSASAFIPYFVGKSVGFQTAGLSFAGVYGSDSANSTEGAIYFQASNAANTGPISSSFTAFVLNNYISNLIVVLGNGDSTFYSTTESTSVTTGAVRINGGLGLAKNINVGGNLRFAGGTVPATATSAGTTGDIRYDGSHLYICTATNTWVRTALSTW